MTKIWNRRLNQYQKKMLKYLRFVFNDHFVIALFFMFGFGCYGYFDLIDQFHPRILVIYQILTGIVLWLFLQCGHLATLFQKADIVFMLPTDYRIQVYLKHARRHSMIITMVTQIVCGLATVPFMVRVLNINVGGWVMMLIAQVLYKWGQLMIEEKELFELRWQKLWPMKVIKQGIPVIGILLGLLGTPILNLIIALIYWAIFEFQVLRHFQFHVFDWKLAIAREDKRIMRLYRFFSLFTNVPEVHQKVKRRRYLDFLLPKYQSNPKQTYSYLYWRGFWRNTEYSGLFMRLTVIGALILIFINLDWVAGIVGLLFIYLTGFQLIPLANQFYDIVFTHLYPIDSTCQIYCFRNLLGILIGGQTLIFVIVTMIATTSLISALILIIGAALICGILEWPSLNKRFNKAA